MSKYLRKFATEAEYSAATLYYPSVALVTDTDAVHFDKSAPAPSGIPFDNTLVGQTIPTSFKILKSELDAVTSDEFGCLANDYTTQLTIVPGESNNRKYYLYDGEDAVYGTVVEEGDYYVFSHNITEFPTIAIVSAPNSPVNLIID